MKWMITEDRLGDDQVNVIDEITKISDKPIWIKGHAGSGKSVLLLHSLADYLVLNPNAKVTVVVFTRALVDLLSVGLSQIPKLNGKNIPVQTIYQLKYKMDNNYSKYDAIFCDEIQDLPINFIKSIKSFCTHLIIAGDAEQSIYNTVPIFEERPARPQEIKDGIIPIEKNLGIIYRLTTSILNVLKRVFPAMLADMPNIAKEDTEIKLYQADTIDEEINFCWNDIKKTNTLRATEVSAVLISGHDAIVKFVNKVLNLEGKEIWNRTDINPDRPNYDLMNEHLRNQKIPLIYIGNNHGSLVDADTQNKVAIMTYHSSKGLDFDYVYLPLVNDDMYIHSNENSLLLVALSRSKSGLFISYTDVLYPGLKQFLAEVTVEKIQDNNSSDIIF
ncbi:AAA family ATPase [Flavobacterium psychrophilum]